MERIKVTGLSLCGLPHPYSNIAFWQSSLSSSSSWGLGARPLLQQPMPCKEAPSETLAGLDCGELEAWQLLGDAGDTNCKGKGVNALLSGVGGRRMSAHRNLTNFNRSKTVSKFFSFHLPERLCWHEVVHMSSLILSFETKQPLGSVLEICSHVGSGPPCIYSPLSSILPTYSFFITHIFYWLCYYSCPIPLTFIPLCPAHALPPTSPLLVHVHGSYI